MIVEHINENPRISAEGWLEPSAASREDRMRIGESVNATMEPNTALDGRRIAAGVDTLEEVAHHVANENVRVVTG